MNPNRSNLIPAKTIAKILFVGRTTPFLWMRQGRLRSRSYDDVAEFLAQNPKYAHRVEAFRQLNQTQLQG